METAHTPRWAHLRRLALCAAALAFAWVAVALVLGLGSTPSHAADDEGVLDPVTSALDGILVTTTDTLDAVAAPAAVLIGDTVESVTKVLPAPVREPVVEVVDAVGGVADAVTDGVDSVPVTSVTGAVVDTVAAVPVVGGVVEVLGVDDAVADLGRSAEAVLGSTTTTLDTVVDTALPSPLIEATPPLPPTPGVAAPSPSADPSHTAAAARDGAIGATTASNAARKAPGPWREAASAASASSWWTASSAAADASHSDSPGPPDGPCLAPAAPSGAAGSSAAASGVLPPSGALDDHRAWGRSLLSGDDDVPTSPAASPDVSPD